MVGPIAAEGHKCLIFTNYLMSVELISEDLDALGVGNLVMTGATGDRQALVHRFQTDPKIQAFIMNLENWWSRTEPYCCRLCIHLRPLVESVGRVPGHRPHPSHRAGESGILLSDDRTRHHRGEVAGTAEYESRLGLILALC